jgi:protein-tyrosine phosphatase
VVAAAYEGLLAEIENTALDIDLRYGAEYTYGPRFHRQLTEKRLTTLAETRYVLLELPEAFMPATMPETLFGMGIAGYFPVLAHPERCKPFHGDVDRLRELATGRALIQVSFRSLAGTFGRTIKKTAWRLVEEGIADLVATDCHHPRELKKVVRPVMKRLRTGLEPEHMNRLMGAFPWRMLCSASER